MSANTYLLRFAFALGVLLPSSWMLAQESSPKETLEETVTEVLDVLHADDNLTLAEKREKVLSVLERSFSFDIIIRRALGRNWNQLTADQQDKVTQLISDLLIRAYTKELKNGGKPRISYSGTEELSSNKIEIDSRVSFNDKLVNVSYRLANVKNRGWQVYDVLVEGVSMVSNYRQQFDEHFQTKTGADLIALLERKLEELDA